MRPETIPPTLRRSSHLLERDPRTWTPGADWHPEWRVRRSIAHQPRWASKVTKSEQTWCQHFASPEHNISQSFKVRKLRFTFPNISLRAQKLHDGLSIFLLPFEPVLAVTKLCFEFQSKVWDHSRTNALTKDNYYSFHSYVPRVFLYVFYNFWGARIQTGQT